MTTSPTPNENPKHRIETECRFDSEREQAEQKALKDPIKQEQYRQEFLRQLRLRSCPGCGESELF